MTRALERHAYARGRVVFARELLEYNRIDRSDRAVAEAMLRRCREVAK